MQVFSPEDLRNQPNLYKKIADTIGGDGLVAFPGKNGYRLGANALSHKAVSRLQQAKRRATNRPALVFIKQKEDLHYLVDHVSELAGKIMDCLWPGPVTIRLKPSTELPSKVRKALTKATGLIGVRIPVAEVSSQIVQTLGTPMLVSSANRSRKHGAQSVAQVRKNFGTALDILVDGGDISPGKPSTIVDATDSTWSLVREGEVSTEEIARLVGEPSST